VADDILARLRCIYAAEGCGQCTFCVAKAEIERLREKVEDLRMYLERDACEIERLQALINAVSDLHDFDHTDNPRCTQCGEWPCSTHLVVCGECKEARRG
jgi:hypothetical protein